MKNKGDFTIVELLIVIVVTAILVTSDNTKIITSISQVIKSISGYIAVNGTYPSTGNSTLVSSTTGWTSNCGGYTTRIVSVAGP